MVGLGVLEKSTLPANSTIFIVQKTSGKWRLICDLRRYNDSIQDYVVHLPSPYELINRICMFDLFSYFDFPDAYFKGLPSTTNAAPRRVLRVGTLNVEALGGMKG